MISVYLLLDWLHIVCISLVRLCSLSTFAVRPRAFGRCGVFPDFITFLRHHLAYIENQ